MGTGKLPVHTWTLEWCLDTHGHRKGALAHMGTERESEHTWALKGFPGTHGHQKGA